MSDRVLPAGRRRLVEGEVLLHPGVDLAHGQRLAARVLDRHEYEAGEGERRLVLRVHLPYTQRAPVSQRAPAVHTESTSESAGHGDGAAEFTTPVKRLYMKLLVHGSIS